MLMQRVKAPQPVVLPVRAERAAVLPGLPLCPLPAPWRELRFIPAIDSTQSALAAAARTADPAGVALWAGSQRQGRGRLDNRWQSSEGGLYVTAALPPAEQAAPLPASFSGWLTLLAALACAETLEAQFGLATAIKWPNDLFASGRKLAGFLGERIQTPFGERLLVGMGLNWLNGVAPEATLGRFAATTLGREVADVTLEDREAFLAGWLARLAATHGELAADPERVSGRLAERATARLWRRGERVRFEMTEHGPLEGLLEGLGPRAAARLALADGRRVEVHCGHQAADRLD